MLIKSKILISALCAGLLLVACAEQTVKKAEPLAAAAPAFAQDAKPISIVVGFSAGGGYDAYARVLSRHFGKYMAGSPRVIVQNMPGASGLKAVNWLNNGAARDGSVITAFNPGLITESLLDPEKVQIKLSDFAWVGSISEDYRVCYAWAATGVKTPEDWLKKPVVNMGSPSPGSSSHVNQALMKNLLGMPADEIGKVFEEWNKGELSSFLIEITADILQQKDPMTKGFLVDQILDTAGQKGTGQWTAANALELGSPANAIAAAVYARALSSLKEERVEASKILKGPAIKHETDKKATIEAIKNALYCSKICAYAQGFQLIDKAQVAYNWKLNFGEIAQIWRGGCIIRARFLQKITEAYALNSRLKNLMLDPYFTKAMNDGQEGWRKVIALAVVNGIPAQGFSAAMAYYDGYRSADLPANLLQGQRDYFGAHTYERKDQPRGQFYHLDWPEAGRPQLEI